MSFPVKRSTGQHQSCQPFDRRTVELFPSSTTVCGCHTIPPGRFLQQPSKWFKTRCRSDEVVTRNGPLLREHLFYSSVANWPSRLVNECGKKPEWSLRINCNGIAFFHSPFFLALPLVSILDVHVQGCLHGVNFVWLFPSKDSSSVSKGEWMVIHSIDH